jgi:membrane protease YdiL (CAAX protease family)
MHDGPVGVAERGGFLVSAARAKRDVWTFLALLLMLSSVFYALVFLVGDAPKQWGRYVLPFMWCPGLAALVTKLVRDGSLRGLGWGFGRTRYFLIAYGLAFAVCLLPYLFVWFAFDAFSRSQLIEVLSRAGLPAALRGGAGLLAVVLVVSPLTGLVSAAGEEIGWRGFLVPRLHALVGFTGTSLLVGLIWAAWHYPINIAVSPLYRPNVPLWYSNACFTLLVVGISFMHTWLRIRSQSLWPSALCHAAGNAFQSVFQAATLETSVTSYLTTEYGASFAAAGLLVAYLFWGKRHELPAEQFG